jgi:hypothetical protein
MRPYLKNPSQKRAGGVHKVKTEFKPKYHKKNGIFWVCVCCGGREKKRRGKWRDRAGS